MKRQTPANYLVIKTPDATSMEASTDNRNHRIHWYYVYITITDSTRWCHLLNLQPPAPAKDLSILQHPTHVVTTCSYRLEPHIPGGQSNNTATVSSPQQKTVLFRAYKPQLNTEPAEMVDTGSGKTCVAVILYPQQSTTDEPPLAP
jgi:hypothetical protein